MSRAGDTAFTSVSTSNTSASIEATVSEFTSDILTSKVTGPLTTHDLLRVIQYTVCCECKILQKCPLFEDYRAHILLVLTFYANIKGKSISYDKKY